MTTRPGLAGLGWFGLGFFFENGAFGLHGGRLVVPGLGVAPGVCLVGLHAHEALGGQLVAPGEQRLDVGIVFDADVGIGVALFLLLPLLGPEHEVVVVLWALGGYFCAWAGT